MVICLAQHILLVFGVKRCLDKKSMMSLVRFRKSRLSHSPFKPRIFRVDDLLRSVNEKAYEPVMVAIGPYHHGKDHLKMMEEQKLQYLQQLLQRRNVSSVDNYVMKLTAREEEARSYYAERREKDGFVEMMLFDGCFIIELFRKLKRRDLINEDDPIFKMDRMLNVVQRDLLLFEYQLPFFILTELIDMTKLPGPQDEPDIIDLALNFLGMVLPNRDMPPPDNFDHLLGFTHHSLAPSSDQTVNIEANYKGRFIECTTKLQRKGILLRKIVDGDSVFKIKVENGVIRIPPLTVDDEFECLFRNLIAYEQYHHNLCHKYVTDYATLMDCLVDSAVDVERLRNLGILESQLGSDEALSDMFNKLCCNITINPRTFCYSQVFNELNKESARPLRRMIGELRYHSGNPMTVLNIEISAIALILALVQIIMPLYTKS